MTEEKHFFYGEPETSKHELLGSIDFIAKFGLGDLYEQHVRPYVTPTGSDSKPLEKMEKSMSGYIRDLPGKNKIKKDHHLRDLIFAPSTADVQIAPFDIETLRDGFTLYPGEIPGFDASVLGGDEDLNDEEAAERKRRKKEKRSSEKKKKKKKKKKEGEDEGEGEDDVLEEDHIVVD